MTKEQEEAIEILEKFMNNEMQRDKLERDDRCGGWKIGDIYKLLELNPAINNLLSEREQDKARIKELEDENKRKDMFVEMAKEVIENSILKQKVKDKIEKLRNDIKLGNCRYPYVEEHKIEILQELLEGEK